jgi:hypothetical protein
MKKLLLIATMILLLSSCSENYSNGERIGFITKFSDKGIIWKSWEGELNLTQTGMNTSSTFPFSVDNDHNDANLIDKIKLATNYGYKVKLTYHETFGLNWFNNRGETDCFVTNCEVLDSLPLRHINTE